MSEDEAEEELWLLEELDMLIFADCFEGVESKVGEEKEVWISSFVRLESGEVGTELQNTLGGGKTQESGNAEGVGKRKCRRSGNAESGM